MKLLLISSTLCLLTLLFSVKAFAIATPLDSKKVDVEILTSAGESFDDNVTYVSEGEKEDFVTSLTAGLRTSYAGQRHQGFFQLEDEQLLFARHSEFNNNAQRAKMEWNADLSKDQTLEITDDFSHAEEPRSFEEEFSRTRGRYSTSRNTLDLTWRKEWSKRFASSAGYGNQFFIFSDAIQRDALRNRVSLSADWIASSANIFSLVYQYINHQFFRSSAQSADSASTNGLGLNLKHYLSRSLYADLGGGADLIHNFGNDNLLRPYAQFSLTQEPDARTRIKLLGFEWRSQTNAYQGSVFESWQVTAGINRELQKRLTGSLAAFFGSGEFRELDIRDNLYGVRSSLDYEIREDLILSLSYNLSLTDSSQSSRDYTKNVTNLKLSYSI